MSNGLRILRLLRPLALATVIAAAGMPSAARAIDPARAPAPIDTTTITEATFLERLDHVEQTLRKSGAPPLFVSRPAVIPLTDSPTLYTTNAYGPEGVPYLGMAVHLFNTTKAAQALDPATVSLTADGKRLRFSDVPPAVRGFVVEIAGRSVSVDDALPKRPVTLPPGKVTSLLMLFAPVENRGKVPSMTLRMELDGKPVELDLNRLHGALLEADVARIGPEGACGVVTIQGAIDGINSGELARRFDELSASGVQRFVISFGSRARPPSPTILGWLDSMAVVGEIGDQYRGLPSLPTEVAELHFHGIPQQAARERLEESRSEEHAEIEAAIVECLWAPYRQATRRLVLDELENGDSRGRAAALICGANAVRDADLSRLVPWIDDPSQTVRDAACHAIARIGSDGARAALERTVREGSARSAQSALTALLGARPQAMVDAGVRAANGPTSLPEPALLRILIESRQPEFAKRIQEAARSGSKEARLVALPAVGAAASEDVITIFEEAFRSPDADLRNVALASAASRLERGDQRLREVVITESLRRLKANASDPVALEMAAKARDPRFVPLLAGRLSSQSLSSSERLVLIERLTQIGGSAAMDTLLRRFDAFTPIEQTIVLAQLWRENPDRALPYAQRLVDSSEVSLAETCLQVLIHDGSDHSVEAIRNAIRADHLPHRDDLLHALAAIGTPAAYDGMIEFRDAGSELLRSQAQIALAMYWQRSPALQVANSGIETMHRQIPSAAADVREAVKLFDAARKIDPLLPHVYRGRGNAFLRLGEWNEAARDFEAALTLDPHDEISFTGLVIAKVMLDHEHEALEWLTAARSRIRNDGDFEYNSACAYARALERQLARPASPRRDAAAQTYREAAFEHLGRSIELGFGARDQDLPLLQKDPDLLALHDDPRFARLVEKVKAAN